MFHIAKSMKINNVKSLIIAECLVNESQCKKWVD